MGTKQDRFTRMVQKALPDLLPTLDAIAKRARERASAKRDAEMSELRRISDDFGCGPLLRYGEDRYGGGES